ncbi:MAG: hypothetical protein QGH73_00390 [Rhodospirillales bacterium]|nr:hypothetical protein [Rhodospirillaceae bacterium]MDP6430207.1 hypothetical protein [Rhodospirillales bacterium]MDP6646197.1 hypothetical protein [Rhodospirillales bacterium]MDP6840115.1 hypothetical protein [Rhodospirillales bacterium]
MVQSAEEAKKEIRAKRQLDQEDEGREQRIEVRRQQRLKQEALKRAKRRKRMVKMAAAWVGVIFVLFLVATWFSGDLVAWLHKFG